MAEFTMHINGLAEIRLALLKLPSEFDKRTCDAALKAGGKIILKDAQSLAPVLQKPTPYRLAGVLKRNIRMQGGKPIPGMTATVIIGVRKLSKRVIKKVQKMARERGKRIRGADIIGNPFYWRFMEFGYHDRRGVFRPGVNGGRGFLRAAFERNKVGAVHLTRDAMADRVKKVADKLSRQGMRTSRGR